jgi:uncharacterized protein
MKHAPVLTITQDEARALAIHAQGLDAPQAATPTGMLAVFQQLGCVQLDPINHIAKTHQLVLRNRTTHAHIDALSADLDALQWRERAVFEYWAHCASLVLSDDFAIYADRMRRYRAPGSDATAWHTRIHAWMRENKPLRDAIVRTIRKQGPLPSAYFDDDAQHDWPGSGWSSPRSVPLMIDRLWMMGVLTVAGRRGNSRLWDVTERALPAQAKTRVLPAAELLRRSVLKSMRALGVGTRQHIMQHFTRGRYPGLDAALPRMVERGELAALNVAGWPGTWYALPEALAQRAAIDVRNMPALLLSPFDNLICDRKRSALMFDFDFRIEIYVPAAKRTYGYYVLPILSRGKLIGRVDSVLDRAAGVYRVGRIFRENGAAWTRPDERAVASACQKLGEFLGASVTMPAKP